MERVKKGTVEPIEVRVPKHGTYKRRALALKDGLDPLIRKEFGETVELSVGEGDEPNIHWTLPENVTVAIWTSWRNSDPRITVRKDDPVRDIHATGRTDRREEFYRDRDGDAKTVFFDAGPVLAQAKAFMETNRKERSSHDGNETAKAEELAGIAVPGQVFVERDGKTGMYEITVNAKLAGLSAEEARRTAKAAAAFAAACPGGKLWRTAPDGA